RLGSGYAVAGSGEGTERAVPAVGAQRDDDAHGGGEQTQLAVDPRGTGVAFGDGRLVERWRTTDGRDHAGADEALAVAGVLAGRLGGQADAVEAGEEPVARRVTREPPARAVAAVRRRSQPDDDDAHLLAGPPRAGRGRPPACDRAAPVGL